MSKQVTLEKGFKRKVKDKEETIKNVTLREPDSGSLRGLKILDVMQFDVTAARTLVPRISDMTANEFDALKPKDLATLCSEVGAFFVE